MLSPLVTPAAGLPILSAAAIDTNKKKYTQVEEFKNIFKPVPVLVLYMKHFVVVRLFLENSRFTIKLVKKILKFGCLLWYLSPWIGIQMKPNADWDLNKL